MISASAVAVMSLSLLWLCLFKSRIRLVGLMLLPIAFFMQGKTQKPLFLVLENGRQIAAFDEGTGTSLLRPRAEKFSVEIWQRAYPMAFAEPKSIKPFQCDTLGCVSRVSDITLAYAKNPLALADDCRNADVLVLDLKITSPCGFLPEDEQPLIIDKASLAKLGSHAIYRTEQPSEGKVKLRIETSLPALQRPWTAHRHAAEQGKRAKYY